MPQPFDFAPDEAWEQNLTRLRAHLESIDPECAAILFANLPTLLSEDANARRDFNQLVFTAIEAAATRELGEGAQ